MITNLWMELFEVLVKIFHFAALRLGVSCSNSKYFYILKLVAGGGGVVTVRGVQFYFATV